MVAAITLISNNTTNEHMNNCKLNEAKDSVKKTLTILDVLENKGVTVKGGKFCAVWRGERVASCSIKKDNRAYYDHGAGKGGDVIDLWQALTGVNYVTAIQALSNITGGSGVLTANNRGGVDTNRHSVDVLSIKELYRSSKQAQYAASRGISYDVLRQYCKLAIVAFNGRTEYRNYYIALRNDKDGYELRRADEYTDKDGVKRQAILPKCKINSAITTINTGADELVIVEGMFDILTLVECKLDVSRYTVIVLNSLSNISDVDFARYGVIHSYLDNDSSGRDALAHIASINSNTLDYSQYYDSYNDVSQAFMAGNTECIVLPKLWP